ncbi:MAG: arylsulfatase, partial [Gemmatimonadaceae bacterium]|nr:arylsulfatase [Acetobacteraceae bacterium]
MRIALIHALRHSIAPTDAAFARHWPEATLATLLDDSLSADLARDGRLTPAMSARFMTLARYAADAGADGILFTCSAFGPCIAACAAALPIPVLTPNQAMLADAARAGHVGLLATFGPTLVSMAPEFAPGQRVTPVLAAGALEALDAGDPGRHDALAAEAALTIGDCDVIALAQ